MLHCALNKLNHDIIELSALCKGGNFNIHIWAGFGYLSTKQGESGSIDNW